MIESPLLDRILAQKERQTTQKNIVRILETRFGKVPAELAEAVRSAGKKADLDELVCYATACPDLDAFRQRLIIS